MKTTFRFLLVVILFMSLPLNLYAQDAQPEMPAYVTITTLYWNMDMENFDMDEWKAGEKEYLEKVTRKNEHVLSSGFYLHRYSATNTELKYVQTYASWEAIDKAANRNSELEKAAWPDKATRDAGFKKRNSYYDPIHSDEIYVPIPGAKPLMTRPTEDMVVYVRISKMAYPENGSQDELATMFEEFVANTIHKNDKVKAYYPNVHGWGADRRDFVEAFYLDSMDDLDDLNVGTGDLINAHWPDEASREAFFDKYNQYFTGEHGDYIYTYIVELAK